MVSDPQSNVYSMLLDKTSRKTRKRKTNIMKHVRIRERKKQTSQCFLLTFKKFC